jgi:hypothetical protein
MPVKDALEKIGHDYGCNDDHYTSLNLVTCQTHIVHRGRPGLRRNSGALGARKRRELLFVDSKLKRPSVNCGDKKEAFQQTSIFILMASICDESVYSLYVRPY